MDLKSELLLMPGDIRNAEMELLVKQNELTKLQQSADLQEAIVLSSIAQETGEDGKKKYPNEAARDGEAKKRLKDSPTWQEKKDLIDSYKINLKKLEIELKYLLNRFSMLKAIARLNEDIG